MIVSHDIPSKDEAQTIAVNLPHRRSPANCRPGHRLIVGYMDIDACTLPSAQRPLRLAEFDELFATALHEQSRPEPTRLRWRLDPGAEARARDLVAKQSACCAFFAFTFGNGGDGGLTLEVRVPPTRVEVLDALAARATPARRGGPR